MTKIYRYIDLPIALIYSNDLNILLVSDGDFLTGLYFVGQKHMPILDSSYHEQQNCSIFDQTYQELTEYINGTRKEFTVPYRFTGTNFQEKVWSTISAIPYARVMSYKDIANLIFASKSVRVVANTVARNTLSIIVPCHRVIGTDGRLTGYAGGLELKKKLLELEESYKDMIIL
ncbi:methylated-DNA--[protein]-cysteine S-methyltransferase [Candidatus Tisiphia endosymbiont of Thecophora atra]|uniref:methylated-DNA--[protein]-cysteine S-methyltransferase n=1 Tax=Candidatus Tisiphia endosymbiont of Thecophora atra TaxID=3066258 RepID=UPI00312CA272